MSLQQIIEKEISSFRTKTGRLLSDLRLFENKVAIDNFEKYTKSFAHRIIKVAFEECAMEDMDTSECRHYEPKVYRLCDHCPSEAGKWNAANKARATKEKEVLATLQP